MQLMHKLIVFATCKGKDYLPVLDFDISAGGTAGSSIYKKHQTS